MELNTSFKAVYCFVFLAQTHCLDCCFISGAAWWTHISSIITNLGRKSEGFFLKLYKCCWEIHNLFCLWLSFNWCGTHLEQSFLIPSSWFKQLCTAYGLSDHINIWYFLLHRVSKHNKTVVSFVELSYIWVRPRHFHLSLILYKFQRTNVPGSVKF